MNNGPSPLDLNRLSPELRYLYEERAGIIEFCGDVPRQIAEQEAWKEIQAQMKKPPAEAGSLLFPSLFGGK